MTTARDHALVLGASMAGLAAAAALAPRYRRVTVLERHARPEGVASVVPQGRLPHVLLRGGAEALDRLLPGFVDDLVAAGAHLGTMTNGRWWSGGWRIRPPADGSAPLASRALIEAVTRRRVEALANVTIAYGRAAAGLAVRSGRVAGVLQDTGVLDADLVVDTTGRGSSLPRWLEAAGYPVPKVTEVGVDLCYQTAILERQPNQLAGNLYMVVQNVPPATRLGIALAVENNRWLVLLGSYFGDRPPADLAGMAAFAETLPVPELAELLHAAKQAGPAVPYRFGASRRVHYERLAAMPAGVVPLGDAIASFNPIYGQGMSVAALQAERLGHVLDRTRDPARVTRSALRRMIQLTDMAWSIAAGGDFAYPQTTGVKPRGTDIINGYVARVLRACAVDPKISLAMEDVQSMVAPPQRLMSPGIALRVLRAGWRLRGAPADPGGLRALPA
jgi:2-polyprenyl-6-methoxyphenol hydroxylase-like FAD-dependent oxidoreductase